MEFLRSNKIEILPLIFKTRGIFMIKGSHISTEKKIVHVNIIDDLVKDSK